MPGIKANTAALFREPIEKTFDRYEITTPLRQCAFLAQAGHETASLKDLVENLNYSADSLQKVFNKYFPTAKLAAEYAHKPERIANRVYANRMGNGPEESGDGWKFRGRGIFMTTGAENYMRAGLELGYDFITNPDALVLPGAASFSAGFYWRNRGLNVYADRDDIKTISLKINGGTNGMADRVARYEIAKKAYGIHGQAA